VSAAVITGAAGDLGRALTEAFVAEGYRVFGGDLLPCAPRAGLTPVQLDVTDRAAVFALAERAADPGPLRLWINAAGIVRVVKIDEADPADWERIIAVNLTGTFHGCAAALAVMRRPGRRADRQPRLALRPGRRHRRPSRLWGLQGGRPCPDQELCARGCQARRALQCGGTLGARGPDGRPVLGAPA
jgi:NAD(P)-dependent dehydrogenase (short-subunit alcohol dehydrogenase family)